MGIIYQNGSKTITVPYGDQLSITNSTGEHIKIYEKVYASNVPDAFKLLYDTPTPSFILGVYSRDQEIKIESQNAIVNYNLSSTPIEDQTGSIALLSASGISQKNYIMNPDFAIWQRSTSTAGITVQTYVADRWKINPSGATITCSRQSFDPGQTDVPCNPKYFCRVEATSADDNWGIFQPIEDVSTLSRSKITLSFYAKADAAKTFRPSIIQVFGGGGSSNVTRTGPDVSLTTEWQKFSWSLSMNSIFGKTVGTSSYLRVNFVVVENTDGYFDISNVQLTNSLSQSDFVCPDPSEELLKCQRYFEKSYDNDTNVGTATNTGSIFFRASSAETLLPMPSFMTTKREQPAVAIYSPSTGASGNIYNGSTAADVAVSSVNNVGDSRVRYITLGAAVADGNALNWHYTADSDF